MNITIRSAGSGKKSVQRAERFHQRTLSQATKMLAAFFEEGIMSVRQFHPTGIVIETSCASDLESFVCMRG
jgi:hypothetical protein